MATVLRSLDCHASHKLWEVSQQHRQAVWAFSMSRHNVNSWRCLLKAQCELGLQLCQGTPGTPWHSCAKAAEQYDILMHASKFTTDCIRTRFKGKITGTVVVQLLMHMVLQNPLLISSWAMPQPYKCWESMTHANGQTMKIMHHVTRLVIIQQLSVVMVNSTDSQLASIWDTLLQEACAMWAPCEVHAKLTLMTATKT